MPIEGPEGEPRGGRDDLAKEITPGGREKELDVDHAQVLANEIKGPLEDVLQTIKAAEAEEKREQAKRSVWWKLVSVVKHNILGLEQKEASPAEKVKIEAVAQAREELSRCEDEYYTLNWVKEPVGDEFFVWGKTEQETQAQAEQRPRTLYRAETGEGRSQIAFGVGERGNSVEILLNTAVDLKIGGKQGRVKHLRIELDKDGIPLGGAYDLDGVATNISDPEMANELMRGSGVWDHLCRAPEGIKEQCAVVRKDTAIEYRSPIPTITVPPDSAEGGLKEPIKMSLVQARVLRREDPEGPVYVQREKIVGVRAARPDSDEEMVYYPLIPSGESKTSGKYDRIHETVISIEEGWRTKK